MTVANLNASHRWNGTAQKPDADAPEKKNENPDLPKEKADADLRKEPNTGLTAKKKTAKEQNPAAEKTDENRREKSRKKIQPMLPPSPEVLRLQYSYELERSREISSSVNRLTMMIPIMIFVVCFLVGVIAPMCTDRIPMGIYMILGTADVIVLLGGLVVACTVHFYILNPAPSQTEEYEWMIKMKRDLQRGNNWRAWLVFAATVLIYVSAAVTLAILILCLVGR